MSAMSVLVIVPTYNEVENLEPLVAGILAGGPGFQALVIDDDSPDGTGVLADDLARRHPGRVTVIHRQGKQGLATAYLAGFRHGLDHGAAYLAEMDADGSHDPAYLPHLLDVLHTTGADVVLGSRYVRGGGTRNWPLHRRLMSRWGSRYAAAVLGLPFRDLTGGFKMFRREALERLDFDAVRCTGYGFQIEVTYRLYRQHLRIVETPIVFRERMAGASKMDPAIFLEALLMVPRLRLDEAAALVPQPDADRRRGS
jgi:dolichol-phosphate mannosyltransferase